MKTKKYFFINCCLLIIAGILSLGSGISCCLSFGHGLGDIAYLAPFWGASLIYLFLMLVQRKKFFLTLQPPLIFALIIAFHLFNLTLNRGPECSCNLF